jgi:hypothetical protein
VNPTTPRRDAPGGPPPFWLRLNSFFAFPLQREPLLYALLLSLCGLLMGLFMRMGMALGALLVVIGYLLAMSRYAFKVMALASQGLLRTEDYPLHNDPDWKPLPWKLFALLLAQALVLGFIGRRSPSLYLVLNLLVSLALPAAIMVLVQSMSLRQAINPLLQWETLRAIGAPYLLLCLFLFLLSAGAPMVLGALLPALGLWLALPALLLVLSYFAWVMASLTGYVMYQYHEALGIELLPGAGEEGVAAAALSPEKQAERQLDAEVGQMVADGDLSGALATAREAVREAPEALAAHRRYHRVLLQSGQPAPLAEHGRRLIALLLARGERAEALRSWSACQAQAPDFALEDAGHTLVLAEVAWKGGDARTALALLKGFDKRHPGHASVPQAYELIVRVLVQGLGRHDMARRVLQALQQRYPDSPSTREAEWLLRAPG